MCVSEKEREREKETEKEREKEKGNIMFRTDIIKIIFLVFDFRKNKIFRKIHKKIFLTKMYFVFCVAFQFL